jgi:hypothetical protein
MSLFWVEPYRVISRTWKIPLAIRQNHLLLQIAGEPCYLIRRILASARELTEGVVTVFDHDDILDLVYFTLWDELSDNPFPDDRTLAIKVDGEEWTRVFDKNSFDAIGEKEYAIEKFMNAVDQEGNPIEDKFIVWLNLLPYSYPGRVDYSYKMIAKTVDTREMQPSRDDCPDPNDTTGMSTGKSLYGFDQYKKSNAMWRGKKLPNTFPLAFPDVMRQRIELSDPGFVRVSEMKHWTSPPPLCPIINEQDIIVRRSNKRRYEVTNQSHILIGGKLVQQQFDMTEVDSASSVNNIAIEES